MRTEQIPANECGGAEKMENMRTILYLTGLEYKKLWKKKMTWISIGVLFLAMLVTSVVSALGQKYYNGMAIGSHMEWRDRERKATKEKESVINAAFLAEAEKQYGEFLTEYEEKTDEERDAAWYIEAYSTHVMPYETFLGAAAAFGSLRGGTEFGEYYKAYEDYLRNYYEESLSGEDMEDFVAMSKENQPFSYGWMRGYDIFIGNQQVWGLFTCLVVAICLAGMFAGETSVRMDALLLSARYGKNKLLAAKLLCGLVFSLLFAAVSQLVSFLMTGAFHGFEGADIAAQMNFPFIAWNVTMGELALILAGSGILAALLTAALTMLLSARAKSSSPVLIVMFVFLFVPMFVGVPYHYRIPAILFDLLPTNLMASYGSFSEEILRIGDCFVTEWQYAYPVYLLVGGLFVAASYRSYKYHQVGR